MRRGWLWIAIGMALVVTGIAFYCKPDVNKTLLLTGWLVFVALLQAIVYDQQRLLLERSVSIQREVRQSAERTQAEQLKQATLANDIQRPWVFAGIGPTSLLTPTIARTYPDYKNYGTKPAFVQYVEYGTWRFRPDSPLPSDPIYNDQQGKVPVQSPSTPDGPLTGVFNAIHGRGHDGHFDIAIDGDTYVYGRIVYVDPFRPEKEYHSSFIYLIRIAKDGHHDRPLDAPHAYWECT